MLSINELTIIILTFTLRFCAGSEFAFCLRCNNPIHHESEAQESEKHGKIGYIHKSCSNLKRKFDLAIDLE